MKIHKFPDRLLLFISDMIMVNIAFGFLFWLNFFSGIVEKRLSLRPVETIFLAILVSVYWLILFAFFGLYSMWYNKSRFEEMIRVYKVGFVGLIILYLLTTDYSEPFTNTKIVILSYWGLLVVCVSIARIAIRTLQRHLLIKGIGIKSTLIVGTLEKSKGLLKQLNMFPALGYDIKGLIIVGKHKKLPASIEKKPVMGSLKFLSNVIREHNIEEVIIAMDSSQSDDVFNVLAESDSFNIDYSVLPGPMDMLSTHAYQNQLYGIPLIRLLREPMPPWERNFKRAFDMAISLFVIIFFAPFAFFIALFIKLESTGPVFFTQKRVGKNGKLFTIIKFRSMIHDAEKQSGPVWADKKDTRITRVGKMLRKLRIDELPQFINIFKGDMSFVGPRPERLYFVEKLKQQIPFYPLRLRVKPGITGWAQTKRAYDTSFDDVREKLKCDLYYIENMSLRLDFQIIIRTVYVVLFRKGAH